MIEVEDRFSVHASFAMPDLDGAIPDGTRHVEIEPQDLRATYYDTEDLRLARSGVTLRLRSGESDRPVWTLKLPSNGRSAARRQELVFEGGRTVPAEARDLVTAFVRSARLKPVARLRTRRKRWLIRDDDRAFAEIAFDDVSILEGRQIVARSRELELEHRGLSSASVVAVTERLVEAGAMPSEPISKAVRALGARATAPPDYAPPVELGPACTAGDAIRAAIGGSLARIMTNDPLTRLRDDEGLHQIRVGARRLRSLMRTFSPLVDHAWAVALRAELKWLADELGAVRDLDVMHRRLTTRSDDLALDLGDFLDDLEQRREKARVDMMRSLRSDRYLRLLDSLVEATQDPRITKRAMERARTALPKLVARAWDGFADEVRRLPGKDPDAAFHNVRIKAKRARYAAEAVAPALGRKSRTAEKMAKRLGRIQDQLGIAQDRAVLAETLESAAASRPEDGPFCLAVGRLIERTVREKHDARERFLEEWKSLNRKKRLEWMD